MSSKADHHIKLSIKARNYTRITGCNKNRSYSLHI